ncbi:uncharacterized protein C8Q71DRAFT_793258 [Rhodofomes roseus]|uniref:F-box domain-containing protein n=1 Tax=Rhodofomes roseus TaxID=34475 RepID=A0ABQ8JX48_9APHY|nr:uncharacterized protein C8Q71DRAFT_793258 [Rhodofomes roseus]KAH9828534.1 hypothetical protein C8Q71DRAFT_793258 [Rhodofomes roseus]
MGSSSVEESKAHNLTVPVHRLPHELLSRIFQRTLQRNGDRDVKGSFRLTAVCSHWRDVAQTSPAFWTTIRLDDDVRMLEHFLRCSRNAPISVYANGSRDASWAPKARLLLPHTGRIAVLDLRLWPAVRTEAAWYHVSTLLSLSMPALRSLRVDANDVGVFALPPIDLGLFPQLQSLTLHETGPRGTPRSRAITAGTPPTSSCAPWCPSATCVLSNSKRTLAARSWSSARYISIPTTATVDVDADHAFMPYPLTWSRDVRDPGAIMVMGWMRRLQLAFLERGLTDEDVLGADKLLTIVEDYKDMTAERLAFSNIMMVVRRIFSLPAHKVHRSGEFKFRKRAYVLYLKWQAIAGSGR